VVKRLRDVGEHGFVAAIEGLGAGGSRRRDRGVSIGIGDDAALVRCQGATLLTTDSMVEGTHFMRHWLTPAELGRRALLAAVSDVSAMGGRPRYVLLSLSLPPSYRVRDGKSLVRSVVREAAAMGAFLVGGNLSRATKVSLTVTVVAEAGKRTVGRTGARAGQGIFVTGTLGSSRAGVVQLKKGIHNGSLVDAYRRPPLRLGVGRVLARSGLAKAMIDVSDGLLADLDRLCEASRVSALIDTSSIPVSRLLRRTVSAPLGYVLAGGEEYELLFTADQGKAEQVERKCALESCPVTHIGVVAKGVRGSGVRVRDHKNRPFKRRPRGYEHF
jgi:thiamine-monophosphate kinase